MPLATATALFFVTPFLITIFAKFILKDQIGPRRWLAVIVGFIGVYIILNPNFDNFDYLSRAYTMEMSNTAMLAPDREIGIVLHGSLGPYGCEPYYRGLSYLGFDDFFSYQLGQNQLHCQ